MSLFGCSHASSSVVRHSPTAELCSYRNAGRIAWIGSAHGIARQRVLSGGQACRGGWDGRLHEVALQRYAAFLWHIVCHNVLRLNGPRPPMYAWD